MATETRSDQRSFAAAPDDKDVAAPQGALSLALVHPELAQLIAQLMEIPVARVQPPTRLGLDLGMDSLTRVELLAALEAEFGVALDEQVDEETTVADLTGLLAAADAAEAHRTRSWPLAGWCRVLRTVLQEALLLPALQILCRPQVFGREHLVHLEGPAIFVANHSSHLDAPSLLAAMPSALRRTSVVAAADDYFFRRAWLGIGVSLLLNAFPFARTGKIRTSLERSGQLLDGGWSVVIFPEGTRSPSGSMAPFRGGIGLMAVEMGAPVVPVRLRGTYEAWTKGQVWPRRAQVAVTFGAPLRFSYGTSYETAAGLIEAAVHAL